MSLRRCVLLGLLGLAVPALGLAQAPVPSPAPARTLVVAVDSSLARAMPALLRSFEATRPGVRLRLVTGAPGALLDQVAAGAGIDVLAGADALTVANGVQRRLLAAGLPGAFAGNSLVLVVPARLDLPVQRLADLARPEVQRIAIARASQDPAGRTAREAINGQRLWPSLQARVVNTDDESAALALVVAGEVEAGFVYASSAAAAPAGSLRVVETLRTAAPIRYLAQVCTASRQAGLAAEFVLHLRSDSARAAFERQGLGMR